MICETFINPKRCIFCGDCSQSSKSVEHIIPESLGNSDHVLPRGVVCDGCNNYFARKVERPILEDDYFVQLRHRQKITNKRNRFAPVDVVIPKFKTKAKLTIGNDWVHFGGRNEEHSSEILREIKKGGKFSTYQIMAQPPSENLMSRFLAKIAVETFVCRAFVSNEAVREFFENDQLKNLRNYARRGGIDASWPFYKRRIYDENHLDKDGYQTIHEWDFLYTKSNELYLVIAIFGEEYTFNLGGPEVSGYETWLQENDNTSILMSK